MTTAPPYSNLVKTTREERQMLANMIGVIVRNELEDLHAGGAISEETMPELNTAIRNGIFTGLEALATGNVPFVLFAMRRIPGYWEPPKLVEGYESGTLLLKSDWI